MLWPPAAATSSARQAGARKVGFAVQKLGDLGKAPGAEHFEPRDDTRFRQVFTRQHERLESRGARGKRHRQRAAHRAHRPFEPQLPQHRDAAQPLRRHLVGRGEDAERDRQIESRPGLWNVGGCEVDGDALQGEVEAGIRERRGDAVASFFYRTLRQPHRDERRQAARDVGLDVDQIRVDSQDGG